MIRAYIGLQSGYLNKSNASVGKLISMPQASNAGSSAQGRSTGRAGEAVTAARAKCENT